METILNIENLNILLGKHFLLQNISFELKSGEILGIIGESGGGKSILIKSILNILPFYLEIKATTINKTNSVFYIPQEPLNNLHPSLPVRKTVIDYIKLKKNCSSLEAMQIAIELLKNWQLPPETLNLLPHQLSGGMRQKIFLALAFWDQPDLLLADEPISMLDPQDSQLTQNQLLNLKREGKSAIIVSHNLKFLFGISTHLLFIYKRKQLTYLKKESILANDISHPYLIKFKEKIINYGKNT